MTDYSAAISAVRNANRLATESLVSDTTPDDAARAFQLSDATGAPASVIGADIDGFEQEHKRASADEIIKNNSYIGDFVRAHPLHGPLVSDDLGNLDTLSRTYQRLVSDVPKAAWKGFGEGFGSYDEVGHSVEDFLFPNAREMAIKYPIQGAFYRALGLMNPLEMIPRVFGGLIRGGAEGARAVAPDSTEWNKFVNDAAGMIEYELSKPSASPMDLAGRTQAKEAMPKGQLSVRFPKTGQEAVEATPEEAARQQFLDSAVKEIQALQPWAEAGEEPPPGVSERLDQLRAELAKMDQDTIKQALDDANATALKERSPQKFAEFLDLHPDGYIRIEKQIMAAKPEAFKWIEPERLDDPLTSISVPAKEFLQNFDKEFWPDVKDHVSLGGLTADEAKNLEAPKLVDGEEPLSGIRRSAGLPEYQPLEREVLERGRTGRPIVTEPLGKAPEVAPPAPPPPPGGIPPGGSPPPADSPTAGPGELFLKGAIGRTKPEYKKYLDLIKERDDEDVAWRQKRAERQAQIENTKTWKDRKAEIEPDIRQEVLAQPEIAAWRFFDKGEAFGQKLPRRPKLDYKKLTDDQFAALPESWLREGGLDPDAIAQNWGYATGGDLVDALASVAREVEGTKGDIVDRLTEARVNRQLETELGQDAKANLEEARDHALSLTQMEMLHERVVGLGQELGQGLPFSKADMDAQAKTSLAKLPYGSITTQKLLNEAGKIGRGIEKNLLNGKPLEAFQQAQAHYLVTAMAKEMRAVEKEGKRFEKDARKFRDRDAGPKTFDSQAYTNWIHDLLIRLGRPVDRSLKDLADEIKEQPENTLADFLLKRRDEGKEIGVPDFMVDPSFGRPSPKAIDSLPIGDARQAFAAIRSLIKVGRDEGQVEISGAKLDLKEKLKEVNTQLTNLPGQSRNWFWNVADKALAGTLQAEFLFDRLDYGNIWGLVTQWAWRPMAEAANGKAKLGREVAKAMPKMGKGIDLTAKVENTLFRRPLTAINPDGTMDWTKATPIPFTQKNLLTVMHNLGNVDNLERLATGYGLEPQQIVDWVNRHATKDHWDYVQAFGDNVFKNLYDKANAMYRRISGVPPSEAVALSPIDTPFGQYKGWYHPVIHDPEFPGRYKGGSDALFAKEYVRATPSNGYTKARTDYRGPLDLELDSIPNRINQEIHDISFREAVIQANKLIGDRDFQAHLTAGLGKEYTDMLQRWIADAANGANINTTHQKLFATWSEAIRQNAIGTLVGLNPRTVQKHTITAAINSMSQVGMNEFLKEFSQMWLDPDGRGESNWNMAMRISEELQRRHQNFMEQVTGSHELAVNPPGTGLSATFSYARQQALKIGTTPVAFFDLMSAVPTWLAEYNKLKGRKMSEGDAIYGADTAVRRAHGSSAITSRPQLMRDYPWLASLYGFFNHVANQQYRMAWKAKEAWGDSAVPSEKFAEELPGLSLGLFSYVLAPAIVEELVTPYTNKEKESWGKKAAKTLALGLSSSWIGVRDIARALVAGGDPTIGIAGTEAKAFTDLYRDLNHKDLNMDKRHAGKTIKHAITAIGAATGLTNTTEGDIAEYLYDLHTGQAQPPKDSSELWRGLSRGTTKPPTGPDIVERLVPGKTYYPK